MQLSITHETTYDYTPAVETAQHMAYLQPLQWAQQQLLSFGLTISPEPAQVQHHSDSYGNTRSFFALQTPHRQLKVIAQSQVLTSRSHWPQSLVSWNTVRERFRYQAGQVFDAANEFVFDSPMVPRLPELAQFAMPSFTADRSLLDASRDLMARIHQEFIYEGLSTQVNTPMLQAFNQRKGVCQDFAHIMLSCLRTLGLPARYVSGYLLTHPAPGQVKLRGSDASHAWVAVYVPDLPLEQRWVHLDPTNNRAGWPSPGEDYVVLATGRDFSDVSPMRGVIHGGNHHVLTVGVTVEPADPALTSHAAGNQACLEWGDPE